MNDAVTTKLRTTLLALLCGLLASTGFAEDRVLRALIIDGQNNHDWKSTTSIMKQTLTNSGRFAVDVATSPAKGQDMSTFRPNFDKYDVVISNYNCDGWSLAAQSDFSTMFAVAVALSSCMPQTMPFPSGHNTIK